jgi:large subunit ribosomal protein L22
MEAKAITRYIRIAPRKMRLVIDQIRWKPVTAAYEALEGLNKKAAQLVAKTLRSAEANAKVKRMDENRLYVQKIHADGGPVLKRYMSRSMGRADVILKRTTHLSIVLGERELRISQKKKGGVAESASTAIKFSKKRKEKKAASAAK